MEVNTILSHIFLRNFYLYRALLPLAFLILPTSCQQMLKTDRDALFVEMPAEHTRVDFVNRLDYKEEFNIYRYRNFYNGGGVGLGDINNDGLIDIYFTSNMHSNRLYLNKGDFQFEDITGSAGVGGTKAWSTGVSMVDINGDGWLDIYVCNSGDKEGDKRENELFINNGDLTFREAAKEYGIDDRGFSIHAAFFDYDRDGDLDLYLLNNFHKAIGSFNLEDNQRHLRDTVGGDKLFRNDGSRFVDVSIEAGIYGSIIGFGLGVTVGDVNQDGWFDIYVSNDFFEKDYLYINNRDGTFTEKLEDMMRSISAASMGSDMADINNDMYPEIFVTDMLPEYNDRIKTKTTFDNWANYEKGFKFGYYHQFTRNMLHLNNADGTFSEIGRLAGVHATDWSWGALIFDMDNDGMKDLFVANGIYQDLTDQDYIQYFANPRVMRMIITDNNVDYARLIEAIPSVKISSYAFQNLGNYQFEDQAAKWGLATPSHSNGSAYGDLDNDGDLDLVVNNVNMPAFVYNNQSRQYKPDNHYIAFDLKGGEKNRFAIGARIMVFSGNQVRYIEQMPMRGFQSTVDHRPLLGLGQISRIDSLIVEWPDKRFTVLRDLPADTLIALDQSDAVIMKNPPVQKEGKRQKQFAELFNPEVLDYRHEENYFVDFNRESLIYHMKSTEGPKMVKGDVNGDGLEDIYIGGAKDSPGGLFVQQEEGNFIRTNTALFEKDKVSEDTDAEFFDADNDGDLDLYVTSGGNEFPTSSSALIDRLYFNQGNGRFIKSDQILPASKFESSSCVRAADFDDDGVMELFVGIRLIPFLYGVPASSYILDNDGTGNFRDVTAEVAPDLNRIGLVTDMQWADIDGDGDLDMIITGEWMPVKILVNENGKFTDRTEEAGLSNSHGWWNCIASGDLDKDGDIDFVAGNHGYNSRFKASIEKPVTMYTNDFDRNGIAEQIICTYNGDSSYPMALKHDLINQLPFLKDKYPQYTLYKDQTIEDIFSPTQLENSVKVKAAVMATSLIINNGDGTFRLKPLQTEVQFSPVYAVSIDDINRDGNEDLIMGGNLYMVKPEVGRYDASYGEYLIGDGKGNFERVPPSHSGMRLENEIRDLFTIDTKLGKLLIVARNNERVQVFKINPDQ